MIHHAQYGPRCHEVQSRHESLIEKKHSVDFEPVRTNKNAPTTEEKLTVLLFTEDAITITLPTT